MPRSTALVLPMSSKRRWKSCWQNVNSSACSPTGARPIPVSFCIIQAAANCPQRSARSWISRGRLLPREHRLPLLDERLHGLLVIGGRGQADQAFGFVVARGLEVKEHGFVEIVLHVAQREARAL